MQQTSPFDGFGQTCPDPQEVTNVLASFGLSLDFQLNAQYTYNVPDLPAQYHYRDAQGMEVIFLAGKDHPESGTRFPPHQSRWWIFGGAHRETGTLIAQELASRWGIAWQDETATNHHYSVA